MKEDDPFLCSKFQVFVEGYSIGGVVLQDNWLFSVNSIGSNIDIVNLTADLRNFLL